MELTRRLGQWQGDIARGGGRRVGGARWCCADYKLGRGGGGCGLAKQYEMLDCKTWYRLVLVTVMSKIYSAEGFCGTENIFKKSFLRQSPIVNLRSIEQKPGRKKMERNMFRRFSADLKRLGQGGVGEPEFSLGTDGKYSLQYIPFEHVNADAKLVIVGITPGNNQLDLAYQTAQKLLKAGRPDDEILTEVKKVGAFGGPAMKPNLLKILRHFHFERLLGIDDVATLWEGNANLLHSTSTVPHAAFKSGDMFAGSFEDVLASPLLRGCFLDCFVPSAREMNKNALFVGLGPCPSAALEWCVQEGVLDRAQVLGSFCHPARTGGSTVKYYLRQVARDDLKPADPVRYRTDWLDQAYEQMRVSTASLLGESYQGSVVPSPIPAPIVEKSVTPAKVTKTKAMKSTTRMPAATDADITTILKEVERAGYKPTNSTAKLSEFQSPGGITIYVVKTTSKLNNINLMVHPGHKQEDLRSIDGVDAVSDEHRFHSNMTKFPKRINKGQTQTAYGWQLSVNTLSNLPRFLAAFKLVSF